MMTLPTNSFRPRPADQSSTYTTAMSRSKVEALELFAGIMARDTRTVTTVSRKVWSANIDPRRLFTGALKQQIVERDGCICGYCGRVTDEADIRIDHIIPHSVGGQTVLENGIVACVECNLTKSNKVW